MRTLGGRRGKERVARYRGKSDYVRLHVHVTMHHIWGIW